MSWKSASAEIFAQSGKQFDPDIVDAFRDCEDELKLVFRELVAA